MSALTSLAALEMRYREEKDRLLKLKCGGCGHRLSSHSIYADQCAGVLGGKVCKCARWRDPQPKGKKARPK